MTVPPLFNEYEQLWRNPQNILGDLELTTIVIFPPRNYLPKVADFQDRLAKAPSWLHVTFYYGELHLSPNTRATRQWEMGT